MDNIKYVVDNCEHVKIHHEKIYELIDNIENKEYSHWSEKDDYFIKMTEKEIIIFSFLLESLNFCFWSSYDWKINYNDKDYIGSDALLFVLLREVKEGKLKLDINELHKVTKNDFYNIMNADNIYPVMMEERYTSFKETIEVIYNNDNFWNELYKITKATELEKYITGNFDNFKDISTYKGRKIVFNKRCRLVLADLFYVSKTIHNNIKNIDKIKGCADYSLPRYFREIGIIEYSKELSNIVDNEIEIKHSSNYEVEIRAVTLCILEIIKQELAKKNIKTNSIELDNILWCISRKVRKTKPHHTMSIYY